LRLKGAAQTGTTTRFSFDPEGDGSDCHCTQDLALYNQMEHAACFTFARQGEYCQFQV